MSNHTELFDEQVADTLSKLKQGLYVPYPKLIEVIETLKSERDSNGYNFDPDHLICASVFKIADKASKKIRFKYNLLWTVFTLYVIFNVIATIGRNL